MRLAVLRSPFVAALLAAAIVAGCSSKDKGTPVTPDPGPSTTNITVSNAAPATGNGTLAALSVTIQDVVAAAVGPEGTADKRVTVRGTAGGKEHKIEVDFESGTSAITSVSHRWADDVDPGGGAPDAHNACNAGGTACAPSKVSVNQTTKRVTFTNLVLPDALGGSTTSTINGLAIYP